MRSKSARMLSLSHFLSENRCRTLPDNALAPRCRIVCLADYLAVVALLIVAAIAAATFRDYGLGWDDYTQPQYGDLLLALYASGFADRRAFASSISTCTAAASTCSAALAAKILPFDLFETRRLVGAAVGIVGLIVTWRIGRRIGGPLAGLIALAPARHLPALLRAHVHQPEGRAVRGRDGAAPARPRARLRPNIPSPTAPTVVLVRDRPRARDRLAHHRRHGALYAAAARWHCCSVDRGARARAARCGHAARALRARAAAGPRARLCGDGAGLAVGRGRSAQSVSRASNISRMFFEKPWQEMFDGALMPVPDMPRSYVPTLFALQTAGSLSGCSALAGIVLAAASRARAPRRAAAARHPVAADRLPPCCRSRSRWSDAARPCTTASAISCSSSPPLAALGGLAGERIVRWLARRGRMAAAARRSR